MNTKTVFLGVALMFVLCLVVLPGVAFASANITSDVGSYHIAWSWDSVDGAVYIDGSLIDVGDNVTFYVLGNLNPGEKHRIDIYNETYYNFSSSVDTTKKSLHQIFLIVAFVIVCICLSSLNSVFSLVGFVPATGLLMYLAENNFEGWLILFVAFLWVLCLLFGAERLSRDFGKYWRNLKRK